MRRKTRRLKGITQETIALLEYLLAESYEAQKEFHYRLRLPYGPGNRQKLEFIIDLSIYFDGELNDERTNTKHKIAGPSKKRH